MTVLYNKGIMHYSIIEPVTWFYYCVGIMLDSTLIVGWSTNDNCSVIEYNFSGDSASGIGAVAGMEKTFKEIIIRNNTE